MRILKKHSFKNVAETFQRKKKLLKYFECFWKILKSLQIVFQMFKKYVFKKTHKQFIKSLMNFFLNISRNFLKRHVKYLSKHCKFQKNIKIIHHSFSNLFNNVYAFLATSFRQLNLKCIVLHLSSIRISKQKKYLPASLKRQKIFSSRKQI